MKYLVRIFIYVCLLLIEISCGDYFFDTEYFGEHVLDYPLVDNYKFNPKLGACYEIFDQTEKVTPFICRRQANYEKSSCIDWISESERYCLGLKTPTNETVEFICRRTKKKVLSYHSDSRLKSCFKVYKTDKSFTTVCQQTFDNFSIGIVTPDNFTILFDSYFCTTSISKDDRKVYDNFINNFSLDPELRSCYKIYRSDQIVSPYTCLSKDVHDSCVHDLPKYKNCVGIETPNNETVILGCADNSEGSGRNNCFKIYTLDNKVHMACQKKLEERCVGIITPSNLTVLFECEFCSIPNLKYSYYDIEEQREFRKFVKSYLTDEYLGKNSYPTKSKFEVFETNEYVGPPDYKNKQPSYPYWLPNTDCYALTLKSNETIILECISKKEQVKPGCFRVLSQEKEDGMICIKVLEERCVGITTPQNLSVALACYPSYYCQTREKDILKSSYYEKAEELYNLFPTKDLCYEVYGDDQEITPYNCQGKSHPENYSCIDLIPGKKNCLGLITPKNETIELLCGNSTEDVLTYESWTRTKNCFNVYSPEGHVENICQKIFGNYSIGITTPKSDSILFESLFCKTYTTLNDIKSDREFLENFTFDPNIRSCYKVYTQNQVVSSYTCLSREVYDACLHQLEDPNCVGITTQNNEIVVLHCSNDNRTESNAGCFKVSTPDNKQHSVCLQKLDEGCIGIITPSNLTVLFECRTCLSPQGESQLRWYLSDFRRQHRKFVKDALNTYQQGNYSFEDVVFFKVYSPLQEIKEFDCFGEIEQFFVHLLYGHNTCRGLTLNNLETIVLDCPDQKLEKRGCFDVYSPTYGPDHTIVSHEQKVQNVCVQLLNEQCVGIITPGNWTLPFECHLPSTYVCGVVSVPRNRPERM